jgi:hypothetical protein
VNYIHHDGLPSENATEYLPCWQSAPISPNTPPYNHNDLKSIDDDVLRILVNDQMAVLTAEFPGPDFLWHKYQNHDNEPDEDTELEPVGYFDYPILDTASDALHTTGNNVTRNTVGVFRMLFVWRDYLLNIFEEDAEGIVVVFENHCNGTFTYQIVSSGKLSFRL